MSTEKPSSDSLSVEQDRRYLWHPFTPLDEWLDPEFQPILIASAQGSWLIDEEGKAYLDGNSSIWTTTHGHCHPRMVKALQEQLAILDHASFLGLSNPLAASLGEKLAQLTGLQRHFFSGDGSSAMETALKIATQFFQQNSAPERRKFITLSGAYHGDTVGAMSLGKSPLFQKTFQHLMFETETISMPGCYRCPFNQASFEKTDARLARQCQWQCVTHAEEVLLQHGTETAALVVEPRVQGAAGMVMQPEGYFEKIAEIPRAHDALLIVDEVFTGMGRTGKMLASEPHQTRPDLIALGKGLSGGTIPFASTAVSERIFQGFRGDFSKTFFHGHSYSGNPLGCRAALTNLELFEEEKTLEKIHQLSEHLKHQLSVFWRHDHVGDVRQEGLIVAIELVKDRQTKEPFPFEQRVAFQIHQIAAERGLLSRGLGSVLFLIPPYSTTVSELDQMVQILDESIEIYFRDSQK